MISKIPVLGDIIIPKEAGEGLFGISFKMKGPLGNNRIYFQLYYNSKIFTKDFNSDKIAKYH